MLNSSEQNMLSQSGEERRFDGEEDISISRNIPISF